MQVLALVLIIFAAQGSGSSTLETAHELMKTRSLKFQSSMLNLLGELDVSEESKLDVTNCMEDFMSSAHTFNQVLMSFHPTEKQQQNNMAQSSRRNLKATTQPSGVLFMGASGVHWSGGSSICEISDGHLEFDSDSANFAGSVSADSIDTGNGVCEVYEMDQPVTAASDVAFNSLATGPVSADSIDTGNGACEVYAMDQPVTTASDVAFNSLETAGFVIWSNNDTGLDSGLIVSDEETQYFPFPQTAADGYLAGKQWQFSGLGPTLRGNSYCVAGANPSLKITNTDFEWRSLYTVTALTMQTYSGRSYTSLYEVTWTGWLLNAYDSAGNTLGSGVGSVYVLIGWESDGWKVEHLIVRIANDNFSCH